MATSQLDMVRRTPTQRRSRDTVGAILEATARVLVAEGPAAASTNRIAKVAGVGIGTLYQYFASREEILDALSNYSGAVVLVSHDEGAVEALNPERVLILPDGTEDFWNKDYADLISLA